MTDRERALCYLGKKPLLHVGMIAAIERGTAELLYVETDGVLLREQKSGAYMLSADCEQKVRELADTISQAKLFFVHQSFAVDYVKEKYGFSDVMECYQAVYTSKEPIPVDDDTLKFRQLEMKHLPLVVEHYNDYADSEYIEGRIKDGDLFGGFIGETLCGFVGAHEEGSLGILHVLEPYRNKGYGLILESRMINHALKNGQIPFAQIAVGNEKSINLQRKLGLEIFEEKVYWMQ